MQQLISPFCLLLALAMLIAGFAIWAVEPPQPNMELHRARVSGDEAYSEVLEEQLKKQRWSRNALLMGLFGGSGTMVVVAFLMMSVPRNP
jgi:hypothetical protein